MANRPATEPRLAAERHDAVPTLALGALSALRSAEKALRRPPPAGSEPHPTNEPLLLAALGIIAIGRSLARWLDEVAPPPSSPDRDVAPRVALKMRDLLR